MREFLKKIEKVMLSSVILKSMRNGVMATLPLVIIGAIFMIIASLPTLLPFLPNYPENIYNAIMFPYTFLNGILSVAAVAGIGYYHAKTKKVNQLYGAIMSVAVFLLVTNSMTSDAVVETTYLGASGLFTGILVAFGTIYVLGIFESKNLKLKLPDSVPPAVSAPFEYMLSGGTALLVFYLGNILCLSITGGIIPQLVAKILAPLFIASDSLWFCVIGTVFIEIMWFFGVHGFSCISGILMPILLGNLSMNAELVAAGQTPTYYLTFSLFLMAGNLFWFIPLMFMRCKSEQLKAIGKISLIPAIFNISEPIVFGAPLVGNITLTIPNVLYGAYNATLLYVCTQVGLLNPATVYPGNIIPHPLFGYLSTQDWRVLIIFVAQIVGSWLIWLPFVKKYDAQLVAQEKAKAE